MKERSTHEGQAILNSLFLGPDASVIEQQLQEKLDAELDKPLGEMNLTSVDEILAVLEPRKVTEAEISAGAAKLKQLFRARFQDEQYKKGVGLETLQQEI